MTNEEQHAATILLNAIADATPVMRAEAVKAYKDLMDAFEARVTAERVEYDLVRSQANRPPIEQATATDYSQYATTTSGNISSRRTRPWDSPAASQAAYRPMTPAEINSSNEVFPSHMGETVRRSGISGDF